MELALTQDFMNCFIVINKQQEPGKFIPVYKTECLNSQNCKVKFRNVIMDTYKLCNANLSQQVMFVAFQYQNNGNHKKIGSASIELARFIDGGSGLEAKMDKNGSIKFSNCAIEDRVSFLDYVMGGCEIGVHIAIDFTLSNGQPSTPGSLHYLHPSTMRNQYTDAIYSICNILQNYDHDQMFPVYGFGGRIAGKLSHCFALNGNIFQPECSKTEGVLKAYYDAVNKVELYGGTHFSSVLNYVNGHAELQAKEMSQFNQKYTICLIITDGIINDLEQTIDKVVIGSDLPLSIIIVGVGEADFSQMVALDGDVTPLFSRRLNRYVSRDIVQFVPFREVHNDPVLLAKKVLEEVPKQVTDYFQLRGMRPNPKKVHDKQQLIIQSQMKNKMVEMMGVAENYFMMRKIMLFNHLVQQGLDPNAVKSFIDMHGVPEEDPYWVMNFINDPNYVNVLRLLN